MSCRCGKQGTKLVALMLEDEVTSNVVQRLVLWYLNISVA